MAGIKPQAVVLVRVEGLVGAGFAREPARAGQILARLLVAYDEPIARRIAEFVLHLVERLQPGGNFAKEIISHKRPPSCRPMMAVDRQTGSGYFVPVSDVEPNAGLPQ